MKMPLAIAMLLTMAPALADEAAPSRAPAADPEKARPPLKLRLDDTTSAAPRITFEPRERTGNPTPPDTLPALGGRTLPPFEQKAAPGAKGSPYPPDTNPSH
jgi:hypothetical protein